MKRLLFCIITLFLALTVLMAQTPTLEKHESVAPGGYRFWLAHPADTATAKPAIIFLHGASLCGRDLDRVKRYGPLDALERGRNIDAYIIAPQNPGGSWRPDKIMDVLAYVKSEFNVDSTRVYVMGMSLGGYGTADFAATYPDDIAAAIAICGGTTLSSLDNLNKLPFWVVHGTGDRAVSVRQSDLMVEAMKIADEETPRLVYDRVPGMNHSTPARIFYIPEVYEWLFSHSLSDEGRPVAEPQHITDEVLKTAYKGIHYKSTGTKSKSKKRARRKTTRTGKK